MNIPERWGKEDPDGPSRRDLVLQLTKVVYDGWNGPLPANITAHWDRLLIEVGRFFADDWDPE